MQRSRSFAEWSELETLRTPASPVAARRRRTESARCIDSPRDLPCADCHNFAVSAARRLLMLADSCDAPVMVRCPEAAALAACFDAAMEGGDCLPPLILGGRECADGRQFREMLSEKLRAIARNLLDAVA